MSLKEVDYTFAQKIKAVFKPFPEDKLRLDERSIIFGFEVGVSFKDNKHLPELLRSTFNCKNL